jgi:DNA-binding phage protein
MTLAYNPTRIDFSALADMGQNIGQGLGHYNLGTAMKGAMVNGKPDYNKMMAVMQERQPVLAAKMATEQANNNSVLDLMKYGLAEREFESKERARTKLTPTDKKAKWDAEDKVNKFKNAKAAITEAQGYLKGGIYEKGAAPVQTALGTTLDVGGLGDVAQKAGLTDKEKAVRTKNFLKIVGPAAMERMAQELSGSTAYQEILHYQGLYADPTATNAEREAQLDRIVKAIDNDMATASGRVNEIGAGDGGGAMPELTPGQEVDGYEYLGGDPNDQGSWRATQ